MSAQAEGEMMILWFCTGSWKQAVGILGQFILVGQAAVGRQQHLLTLLSANIAKTTLKEKGKHYHPTDQFDVYTLDSYWKMEMGLLNRCLSIFLCGTFFIWWKKVLE